MPLRQILGLVGSLILFIGVFAPIIAFLSSVVGITFKTAETTSNYFAILAAFSVFPTLAKRYKFLLFTGGGSLVK